MYGVFGTGSAPAKVIVAALNDIGTDQHFFIPWYGKVTPGLEAVYDWVLDNNIEFTLVQNTEHKKAPAVLRTMATTLIDAEDVDQRLLKVLKKENDHALILWDEEDEDHSVEVAGMAIDKGLPTLELNNGLVPIVFNEQEGPSEIVESTSDFVIEVEDDPTSEDIDTFTREELEIMPAAVVKRVASNKGFATKTKEEAIGKLVGEEQDARSSSPNKIIVNLGSGGNLTFDLPQDLLQKIFDLVASETAGV